MKNKLLIDGMSCNHCVNHLNTALTEDIKGVEVIEISYIASFIYSNIFIAYKFMNFHVE